MRKLEINIISNEYKLYLISVNYSENVKKHLLCVIPNQIQSIVLTLIRCFLLLIFYGSQDAIDIPQREIIHFNRFKQLYDIYKKKLKN